MGRVKNEGSLWIRFKRFVNLFYKALFNYYHSVRRRNKKSNKSNHFLSLVDYSFCLNNILRLVVPPSGSFFAIIRQRRFHPHAGVADEATAATPPSRLHFRQLSVQERYSVCKVFSDIFVRRAFPLYSVGFPGPARLFSPAGFSRSKLQTTRWWSVETFAPIDTNIQQCTEQVSRSYAAFNE